MVQRDPLLQLYLLRVYVDGPLRTVFINDGSQADSYISAMIAAKSAALQFVATFDSTWTDNPSTETGKVIANIGINSYLYFYSVYMSMDLLYANRILQIDLYPQAYSNLTYSNHVGPAFYQINRLAVSMNSCFLDAHTSFLDSVLVQFRPDLIPSINASQPLRAFAQKPTYTQNGTVPGVLVCGLVGGEDCRIAKTVLTLSEEPCLYSSQETTPTSGTCCDFAGMQSKITDLTFPTANLACPIPNNNNQFPVWAIVVISIVVVVLLVTVTAVVVFVVRRKRHEEDEEETRPLSHEGKKTYN